MSAQEDTLSKKHCVTASGRNKDKMSSFPKEATVPLGPNDALKTINTLIKLIMKYLKCLHQNDLSKGSVAEWEEHFLRPQPYLKNP